MTNRVAVAVAVALGSSPAVSSDLGKVSDQVISASELSAIVRAYEKHETGVGLVGSEQATKRGVDRGMWRLVAGVSSESPN